MSESKVEDRLDNLEQQVQQIMDRIGGENQTAGQGQKWRKSLGMFNDRPLMKEIDEEGRRIRQQDREQVANDHS